MNSAGHPQPDRYEDGAAPLDQQLEAVLADFLDARSRGIPFDRQAALDAHPELADALEAFFEEHDRLDHAAAAWSDVPRLPPGMEEWECPRQGQGNGTDAHSCETVAWSPDTRPPGLPRQFGDYELLEEVGVGGMGLVYRARQITLNRTVALKMIRPGQRTSERLPERFRTEAEAAARLQHPSIVQVFDVGEVDGQAYYSMQLVEGRTLAELLSDGPLSPRKAAEHLLVIAEAVAYAHRQGIVHRDLKPSNVLLDSLGRPRITDFGLAKLLDQPRDWTTGDHLLGTPAYMSPEQAGATTHRVGPACDIYALGAILFEMLTGRPPFIGSNSLEILWQVRECEPPRPRKLRPKLPAELELICLKCLQRDPRHRYADAEALADDLRRYLNGDAVSVSSLNPLGRLLRTLQRSQHDAEFLTWSHMLRHFTWIILLTHTAVFLLLQFRADRLLPFLWLLSIRGAEFLAMGGVLLLYRRAWYPPQGGPARQLWALWLAYVAGSITLQLISPYEATMLYPQYMVLASLGFLMMGATYWGYCYLIGAVYLAMAVLTRLTPALAPLEFGATWAVSLLVLARHLAHLEPRPATKGAHSA